MFDRQKVRKTGEALQAALDAFGAEHGLAVKVGSLRFTSSELTAKLTVLEAEAGEGGAAVGGDEALFRRHASVLGFKPDDFGREFTIRGRTFRIAGCKPGAAKYTVIGAGPGGGQYVFTPADVLAGFAGAAPVRRRTEAEVLEDLRGVEAALSPENLSWDGERSRSQALAAGAALHRKEAALKAEFRALTGRDATVGDLYPEFSRPQFPARA